MIINNVEYPLGPNGGLLTWHERPIIASQYEKLSLGIEYQFKPSIIIQGLILEDADFTLETVRLYRALHPRAVIVVSTWIDQSTEVLNKIESIGAIIVKSEKPTWAGQQNMNMQIVSSRAGLEVAKESGATHAIKTRSDQRLCAPDLLDYLFSIQKIFPLRESCLQNQRLIAIGLDTFRYRMYGVGDLFLFGEMNDMLIYWSPPLDSRKFDPSESHFRNLREFALWRICEVYFCTEFLKSTGWSIRWTLEDYWRMLVARFCIIDSNSVDLLWPKYSNKEFGPWSGYRAQERGLTELGFRDWVSLYAGIDSIKSIPEHFLG